MALLRFQQQEHEMQMKRMQMMGQGVQLHAAHHPVGNPHPSNLQAGVVYGSLFLSAQENLHFFFIKNV